MAGLYRWCVRPLLFAADAERVHVATLRAAGLLGRSAAGRALIAGLYGFDDARLRIRIGGLDYPNPVALPAGFDKNGVAPEALAALGFGAVDIGSVSARPSSGNPVRPRLHRLPADEGIAVFYGVPKDGAAAVAARLSDVRVPVPLGISLVETNAGTLAGVDEVIGERVAAARPFPPLADHLALNLNCPNSAGARRFAGAGLRRARLPGGRGWCARSSAVSRSAWRATASPAWPTRSVSTTAPPCRAERDRLRPAQEPPPLAGAPP